MCSKNFPKSYQSATTFDDTGRVYYKRVEDGVNCVKSGVPLDNGYVVLYNTSLLLRFDAHINV